ncbi:(2Fe-2S)-binding protein [Brachyspira sp. G79]|uniref:(2Fe-2S)-binding protein n=1 Tax=Brachyspira sp. G79 TaxID=1358104 RepID=UPI000BBC6A9E|nr:(2Fe-2S)-binding protein [Brachyspira sp. G79]PCG19109.1 (2Fe-2S)-binding protein [Brachyspira sp. G79]
MNNDKFICQCKELSLDEIESLKKEYGIDTLKEVVKKTKAGTACGGCRNKLKEIFKDRLK